MNTDLAIVLALLAAAIVMFVANRPRMDAVALLMIVIMPFTGVLTINETLAGFSDPNIILIAALFVIGEGLVRTGVARRLGDWLSVTAGASETRLIVLLMLAVAGLGAFMSSTAVVAIFIPVVLRICQGAGTSPSRLMMPLSFAALMSGMLTLVATSPNLVVNAELLRHSDQGFGFFTITPIGIAVLIAGTAYMLVARRLLPETAAVIRSEGPNLRDWSERYGLAGRAMRLRLEPGSSFSGQTIAEVDAAMAGIRLVTIESPIRRGRELKRPSPTTVVEAGEVLLVDAYAGEARIAEICARYNLQRIPLDEAGYLTDLTQEVGMVEAVVPAESRLAGHTLPQARMQEEYGLTVVGMRHGRRLVEGPLRDEKLKVGDTLLLVGFWSDIRRLRSDGHDLMVLAMPAEYKEVLPAASRAPQALGVLALTVGMMISGVIPNAHAALIGCLLMGLTRCVDFNSAYAAINFKALILIVGMLPFSIALQRTGGVDLAAGALVAFAGESSPRVVLGLLFVITSVLGLVISNTATAVLMAPVAVAVAADLHASPLPFAMIIAVAASAAFMTPISSPVNTLVVGPGNYSFGDFVKIGVPMTLIVMTITLLLVPWLLPL